MCENTCATTHPAAQSFHLNSTSMDALVVGLALESEIVHTNIVVLVPHQIRTQSDDHDV